jgi:hypothetical protein
MNGELLTGAGVVTGAEGGAVVVGGGVCATAGVRARADASIQDSNRRRRKRVGEGIESITRE